MSSGPDQDTWSGHGPAPWRPVRHPVMRIRWDDVAFLHWPYPADRVQRLLPAGLEVETWGGRAWVSLVPLHMRVRPPVGPGIPGVMSFPETNVRTYVTGPGGEPGVWFLSLDAGSAAAVLAGRTAFGLPYFRAEMEFRRDGDILLYTGRRLGT